jgi:hypothetical protein
MRPAHHWVLHYEQVSHRRRCNQNSWNANQVLCMTSVGIPRQLLPQKIVLCQAAFPTDFELDWSGRAQLRQLDVLLHKTTQFLNTY